MYQPHDGKRMRFERIERIFVIFLRDGERLAQHRFIIPPGIEHTFIVRLRQPARLHVQQVHLLGHAHAAQGHARTLPDSAHHVGTDCAFGLCYTLRLPHSRNIVAGKAHRAQQAVVIHVLRLGIHIQRVDHRRLGQTQAAEQAHAQRHDRSNRQKSAERVADLAQRQFQHSHHHSILSTGVGSALQLTDWICPLLTRMTRSAMAVSAELCVMMTTVMPRSRLCSCRSCRICLPVL